MNKLSDTTIAKIHAYRAMNYGHKAIAEEVGVAKSTVAEYLKKTQNRAERSENPLEIYGELNENLLDVRVEVNE